MTGAPVAAVATVPETSDGAGAPPARRRAAPHAPIDSATVLSPTEVTASKLVRADDAYLEGHYPDMTVYPGVFLIESVHEAVIHFVRETHGENVVPELALLDSVRFTTALRPGDLLEVHCTCLPAENDLLAVTAVCTSGSARAALIKAEFRLVAGIPEVGTHA
ncbi:3-hydroxyacyl-ACP dehydratase FabZ family protein [Streptomyces sp. NPDC058045]|uniref:3-hydroxyacyl-ACP dehydratase FabZ family protein n=1 Tax=Streptomyces sp. NPDC058045 TaxID=3346311 RepID=UPI0036DFD248